MVGRTRKKVETVDLFITMTDTSDSNKSQGGSGATKVKFAWKGNKEAYPDDIAKELGVAVAKDNEPGLIYGMNKPRPARVYVNIKVAGGATKSKSGKSSSHKAYLLFADPKKLAGLLVKNTLRGKKYRGGTITSVSLPKKSKSNQKNQNNRNNRRP